MNFTYTADDMKRDNPLEDVAKSYGVELKRAGAEWFGLCPFHNEKTPSFYIHPEKRTFYCHGCKAGGTVIDFVALKENITPGAAMAKLTPDNKKQNGAPRPAPTKAAQPKQEPKMQEECAYDYTDETGRLVYQAIRYWFIDAEGKRKKTFKQRRPDGAGGWIWGMEGVKRVLYRLPRVLKSAVVWIVEGEKDADNLNALGFTATTNVGGAEKWMDGYTDSLKGKDIILCGDNDVPGQKHVQVVLESLAGKVATVRVVKVPAPHKDVSDYLASMDSSWPTEKKAEHLFNTIVEPAPILTRGVNLPVYSMEELEQKYAKQAKESKNNILSLGHWLPSLGAAVRGLMPGELVTILADTGVGKTMLLQNLSVKAAPLQTILFELELPGELTFERYVAIGNKMAASKVYDAYAAGDSIDWKSSRRLNHIFVCPEAGLTPEQIEEYIIKSELKTGEPARLVGIDYVQLIQGRGNRYERMSDAAEKMKVIAKRTNTIVVMVSQVSRGDRENPEIHLHDAKDSGAIENSSGLVLGAWRDQEDSSLLYLKVLKVTKGKAGAIIKCNIQGETLTITERIETKVDPEDAKW